MKLIRYAILLLLICLYQNLAAQDTWPVDYFRPPLDIKPYLSGTFGELRSNHFHTGIDIKTQGVQGKNVFAVADGYVSRINISPYGYGKAIYITHPNSYVSVYGHLKEFNEKIDTWVKEYQYRNQTYAFDKYLTPGELTVKKGDIIAYSGNTGGSGGPHLHFEIREEKTQYPVNPVLCGINVDDNIPPVITTLKLYVMDDLSSVDHQNNDKSYSVERHGGSYKITDVDTISLLGKISFGIRTFDRLNGASNKNGVYSIKLYANDKIIWSYEMKKLSFYQGRYINTLIDYPEYITKHRRIQRSYISPTNNLMIYDKVSGHGIYDFIDGNTYKISYVVTDHFGNSSELKFIVKGESDAGNNNNGFHKLREKGIVFLYGNNNTFSTEELSLTVPANALYENMIFEYDTSECCKSCLSKIHHIHNRETPLHLNIKLSIKPDSVISPEYQNKTVLVRLEDRGAKYSIGGEWKDEFVSSDTRYFGNYTIMLDTVPPEIKPVNVYPGKKLHKQETIKLKIDDDLSGIKSYKGFLNGKWILMEYNVNDDLLVYHFDDRLQSGKNLFKVIVTDNKNNVAEYSSVVFK